MKRRVLYELKKDPSCYISGEKLSDLLGVSRTSVWKYIKELKDEGYQIESSSRKGYRLIQESDILNAYEISHGLKAKSLGREIHYFNTIDSTNTYAKKLANEGCVEGTLVVADGQTGGRGRLGRQWDSAGRRGIWMSVVLRPSILPTDVQVMTLATSVAIVSAIKKVLGIQAGIKWPNDIILDGKKVCGILTEMNSEMEQVNYLVIGMGINVNQREEEFPKEIQEIAISLNSYLRRKGLLPIDKEILCRSELIKAILYHLEEVYQQITQGQILDILAQWKAYSLTLGKEVMISSREEQYNGVARDLTADGKLVVALEDGTVREFFSGEVSVRGVMGFAKE